MQYTGKVQEVLRRRIRSERVKREWSLGKLAKQLTDAGVPLTQDNCYKIERGHRTLTADELIAFARVFGLTVEDLLKDEEEIPTLSQEQVDVLAHGMFEALAFKGEEFGDFWVDRAEELAPTVAKILAMQEGKPAALRPAPREEKPRARLAG